jgi:hypothetical protein
MADHKHREAKKQEKGREPDAHEKQHVKSKEGQCDTRPRPGDQDRTAPYRPDATERNAPDR